MQSKLDRRPGVMLVGHGTRDPLGTRQFFQLGDRLSELVSPLPVRPCLLEFQEPTIPQAWNQLVDGGANHVHVAPLLLFAAGHAKDDIPSIVCQCQQCSPSVTWNQSRALSRHPAVVDLVCHRIGQICDPTAADEGTALVMVGRGSHDPCAQADMRILTEVVASRLRLRQAYTAFYAMAWPRLDEVLDSVARIAAVRRVLVYPHLLFAGRLYDAIDKQIQQARGRYGAVEFKLARYLGPEPGIAQAIAARVNERPSTSASNCGIPSPVIQG